MKRLSSKALFRLARCHHLRLIWDAAQTHGGRFRRREMGSFPDVVCYSLYPSKNTTTGEGGMLTASDASLAAEFRLLRSHGEESRYVHMRLGFSFRWTEVAAAIGHVQLGKLPAVRRHQRNAAFLTRALAGLHGLATPRVAKGAEHAFNHFTLRLGPDVLRRSRQEFQNALQRRGIETTVHHPRPVHRQPIFQGYGSDGDFPVSTRLAATALSLPVHPGLTHDGLQRIVRVVREVATPSVRPMRKPSVASSWNGGLMWPHAESRLCAVLRAGHVCSFAFPTSPYKRATQATSKQQRDIRTKRITDCTF